MKKVSVKVYIDEIGCYERPEECKSEFMCNANGGGNYVEAAFNSSGITDKQFILNLAPWLSWHIKEITPLEEEVVSKLLLKLLSAMKKRHGHKDLSEEDKSVLPVLASFFFFLSKWCTRDY